MLKRARATLRDIVAEYELVNGEGSARNDTLHAAIVTAGFWFVVIFGGVAAGWLK